MQLACDHCHDPFVAKPSEARRGRRFCSVPCAKLALVGPKAPHFKGGKAAFTCPVCHKPFEQWASQTTTGFCSMACRNADMKGKVPHNKGQLQIASKPCENCGGPITGQPALVKKRRFCSQTCFGLGTRGANNAQFKGGHKRTQHAIPEYRKWRLTIVLRDGGRCKWCDSEGHRTYNELEVHHIIPVSLFPAGTLNPANAITLCRPHHNITRGRENEYAMFLSGLIGMPLCAPPAANRKERTPFTGTREQLIELYVNQRLDGESIGRLFRVTGACVFKYIRKWNIRREAA